MSLLAGYFYFFWGGGGGGGGRGRFPKPTHFAFSATLRQLLLAAFFFKRITLHRTCCDIWAKNKVESVTYKRKTDTVLNLPKGKENHFKFISVTFNLLGRIPPHGNEDKV